MRGIELLARSLGVLAICAIWAGTATAGTMATPIEHVVVIFQENVSFDHYFGTYPIAANPICPAPWMVLSKLVRISL